MKTVVFSVLLLFSNLVIYAQSDTTRWAVFGTSIEFGYGVQSTQSWPYLFGQKIGPAHIVRNYGVGGGFYSKTAPGPYIRNAITKTRVQWADRILLGGETNDCNQLFAAACDTSFKKSYQAIVDSIKKWQPGIRIICNLAIHSKHSYVSDVRIDKFNKWVREVAEENGLTVWPFSDLPVGYAAVQGQVQLLNDALHPTVFGYGTMADFAARQFLGEGRYKQDFPMDTVSEQKVQIMPGWWLRICGNKRSLFRTP